VAVWDGKFIAVGADATVWRHANSAPPRDTSAETDDHSTAAHANPDAYTMATGAPAIYGFLLGHLVTILCDYISSAGAYPGKLTFASPGVGSPPHWRAVQTYGSHRHHCRIVAPSPVA